jgi:phosphoribosyl 1,2-cyclic phosphate phosphodiesterase
VAERVEIVDPHFDDGRMAHGFQIRSGPMPVYATQLTLETIKGAFPYLTSSNPSFLDEEKCILERRIALLNFTAINEWEKIENHALSIQCFPVYHGGKYISLGFSIGKPGEFVYISDVKVIPKETWYYLKSLPRIKVLVIDSLDKTGIWSHCGLDEAMDIVEALNPVQAYFTGISCGMGLHDETEQEIQQRNRSISFAYDGMLLKSFKNL